MIYTIGGKYNKTKKKGLKNEKKSVSRDRGTFQCWNPRS